MTLEFRLEDPGEGIHEAEIKEINVSKGDKVADGDVILTVETDKAAVEVPAPFAGVIEEVRVEVGDVAEVGSVLMTYREAGEDETAGEQRDTEPKHRESEALDDNGEKDKNSKADDEAPERTGASGRKDRPVPASPATRRLARELGVDLNAVEASGRAGRVTAEDVRATAEERPEERERKAAAAERRADKTSREARPREQPELPNFGQWGEVERMPLRSIRRTIARRMALSWAQIPHVMHHDEVDITELEQWRREHKSAAEEQGGKLTLTVLVMKALVAALKEFPRFNASLDTNSEEIILKRYYHIGLAVDTDQGLVVPVVRDVDRMSIMELSSELATLANRARAGELDREDMQGGSFTVTNPGPLGGRMFTPIIDYPQVAILGLGQAALRPIVIGDSEDYEIVPRLVLPLCCAFDHRVNDGADAARFMSRLVGILSDTEAIVLSV